jgi:hypothetical protein
MHHGAYGAVKWWLYECRCMRGHTHNTPTFLEPFAAPMPASVMSRKALTNTLVFDIGDVLFSWSASTTASISPSLLKSILNGAVWHEYECGTIDQSTCYERCAQDYNISVTQIREALSQARASLTVNTSLLSLIKELRANEPGIRVYAMSNISVDRALA